MHGVEREIWLVLGLRTGIHSPLNEQMPRTGGPLHMNYHIHALLVFSTIPKRQVLMSAVPEAKPNWCMQPMSSALALNTKIAAVSRTDNGTTRQPLSAVLSCYFPTFFQQFRWPSRGLRLAENRAAFLHEHLTAQRTMATHLPC